MNIAFDCPVCRVLRNCFPTEELIQASDSIGEWTELPQKLIIPHTLAPWQWNCYLYSPLQGIAIGRLVVVYGPLYFVHVKWKIRQRQRWGWTNRSIAPTHYAEIKGRVDILMHALYRPSPPVVVRTGGACTAP